MFCCSQRTIVLSGEGIDLEDRVEIHQLQSIYLIEIALRESVLQIVVHCRECAWVAVGHGCSEQFFIVAHEYKVDAPRVDTDACYFYFALCHLAQSTQYLCVERKDVPIGVVRGGDKSVRETCYLFGRKLSVGQGTENRSSARGTKIDG